MFNGTSETTFSPDMPMTRGMFVTVLGRLHGAEVSDIDSSSFTDVAPGCYYASYIEWAHERGIVLGIGEDMCAPDRAITREEAALIMARYTKFAGYTPPQANAAREYADSDKISVWAKDAVAAMQRAGIMIGVGDNEFSPKTGVTRAEIATMFARYVKRTEAGELA